MAIVTYRETKYSVSDGQSVLEALETAGVELVSSCRNGACQTCKKRVTHGKLPLAAQARLKPTEREAGYFLPCVCYPTEDITVVDIEHADQYEVSVLSVNALNHEMIEVKLSHPDGFRYQAGQFIQVFKSPTEVRTYSLASVPAKNEPLTLQIKLISSGLISQWMRYLSPGEKIQIAGPFGECFYINDKKNQPIIMIGTGSGLSPLYGILHDALLQNHMGDIYLFHGAVTQRNLYKESELRELSQQFSRFKYYPCLSDEVSSAHENGMVLDVAFKTLSEVKGARVFLCGHPEMVKTAQKKLFLAGVALNDIFVDPFS